ncbi:pentatricopeptide repeat-containing protein mitochondrial-like [Gossypium australe]|uniref:Pentatricopeptide repeat-containing protein mitochondrial-like n=1 Tax=Gossypium australe TaxID=47621 RepID=A0A5B6V0A8_9ROSI|nr:pentatricopeptide repeat-containing protein mitochondrial-like [Gossypium australe]
MRYGISVGDMAVRLDLISKVHGVEQAEKYFDSIPDTMRTFQVYGALLNCYAHHKCLEKTEATFKLCGNRGLLRNAISYNVMLNLYSRLGKHDKLDVLMQEMKEKGIKHDAFTNNIRLNAYASSSDIDGMQKFLTTIENDVEVSLDWHAYVAAASAYLKARATSYSGIKKACFEIFLTLYTNLGRKDDVYRIWRLYGNLGKFCNSGYLCRISSLVKLDDLDGAERILAEWESGYSYYDPWIPDVMISAYCRKGFIKKAEAHTVSLIERGVIKEPDAFILNSLATGYQMDGSGWKPNLCTLATCLKFLEGEDNLEAAKELLQLLQVRGHLSNDLKNILDGNVDVSALDQTKGGSETLDGKVQGLMKVKLRLAADLYI